jgi:anhydro-N-acetylmuramic acid kinase
MVVDALAFRHSKGALKYDRGGQLARRGRVNVSLLRLLLRESFYRQPPPKSAGREQFGREFVSRLLSTGLPAEDLIATATALTAAGVAYGIGRFVRPRMKVKEVIVSGGGVHNRQMMAQLAALLPESSVRNSVELGIDPDAKEAIAFAILAFETLRGRPSNLPSATGARRPVVLGKVSP